MLSRPRHKYVLVAIVLTTLFAIAPGNSESRRLTFHEIFVAQTATEMIQSGDFLVPRLAGRPRLKKPPLSYWLSVVAHGFLGDPGKAKVSEFEARLPSLISGLFLILVTYFIGVLVTRHTAGGLIAAALVTTNVAFYIFSRSARPEMIYTLLCAVMILGFVWAIRRAEMGRPTILAAAVAWAAFALSLMAKGPQFPIFILLGIVLAHLFQNPGYQLQTILRPWMVLPALAIPATYFGYLTLQFDNVFSLWGNEMVQGYNVPIWLRPLRFYYPLILIISLAPWLIIVGTTATDLWKRREPIVITLASCVLVSLFLVSFAGKLRPHYVLPLVPVCAVLMAWSLMRVFDSANARIMQARRFSVLFWSQFGMIGVLYITLLGVYMYEERASAESSLIYNAIPWLVLAAASYCVAGMMAMKNLAVCFAALFGCSISFMTAFSTIMIDKSNYSETAYRFVTDVENYLSPDDLLYLNSGRLLQYLYYGSDKLKIQSLKNWRSSGENQNITYFIIRNDQLNKSGVEGDTLLQQPGENNDKAMVLFRPSGLPRFRKEN